MGENCRQLGSSGTFQLLSEHRSINQTGLSNHAVVAERPPLQPTVPIRVFQLPPSINQSHYISILLVNGIKAEGSRVVGRGGGEEGELQTRRDQEQLQKRVLLGQGEQELEPRQVQQVEVQ